MCLTTLLYPAFLESCVSPARVNLDILGEPDTIDIVWYHHSQGRIQDFVLGGAYRDGNGGVPLQTCQGVWESAVSTIIPAPKP